MEGATLENRLGTERDSPCSSRPSKWNGWRLAIHILLSFTLVALAINVSLIAWGVSKSGSATGIIKLYDEACDSMRFHFPWMHLPINVCGTLLLASSNAAMQIISAPTRPEIDRAHPGAFLDIGLMGTRNWSCLTRWRRIVWLLLAVSSLPIQTMYGHTTLTGAQAVELMRWQL